jgi:ribose transport system substrate-binding protein
VIVAASSADCSDTGGPSMFDHRIKYWIGDWPAYIREWGAAQGRWLAGVTKGKAKIIEFAENDLVITRLAQAGFEDAIKDCSGCEILDKVVFTGAQIGTSLQQMAQQALLQHPDANAVYAPYDGVMIAGIGQAVKASGRNDEIFAVGGEGYAENMDLVRENGGQDGGIGVGIRGTAFWEGYANADALNRLFNDVEPEVSGIGVQAFDRDHNMPASGPYQAPIDFVSAYKKAWGID